MQTENRFFDDLARLATGAVGSLGGLRQEVETRVREQFERLMSRMDLVTREEFDAVQAMAAKARLEQEQMAVRLAALEQKLGMAAPVSADPFVHHASTPAGGPEGMVDASDIIDTSPGVV